MAPTLIISVPAVLIGVHFLGKALRAWLVKKATAVNELEDLAKPRAAGGKLTGTVVIAGGSVAGLLTARVCSDHFKEVIVVDPEAWLATDEGDTLTEKEVTEASSNTLRAPCNKRARVAQYDSVHLFQNISLVALRKFFPGYDAEVVSEGGQIRSAEYNMYFSGIPFSSPHHDYPAGDLPQIPVITRGMYETLLRRLVRKNCPNVRFAVGIVNGINRSPTNPSKIASVNLRMKDGSSNDTIQEVSLIIDCTGPMTSGLKWLQSAGFGTLSNDEQPTAGQLPLNKLTIKYDPKMQYVTSTWPITPDIHDDLDLVIPGGIDKAAWLYTYIPFAGRDNRSCGMGRINGDRIQIFCGGWGDVPLVKSAEDIIDFIDGLNGHRPVPSWVRPMVNILSRNRDLATYEPIRIPPCQYVQYAKAANLPSNYIALGDSAMRVNPIFGQGCSKAVIGAVTLDSILRTVADGAGTLPADFSRTFFATQDDKINPIWAGTKAPDYGWKTTVPVPGESLSDGSFMRWYSDNLLFAGTWDKGVQSTFFHVRMFLSPATDFFTPYIAFRVLQQWITAKNKTATA